MDKVQKGIIHLLNGDGVFYASLLMQMQRRHAPDLPESALAAVSVENGRILLHVDPPRLEKFGIDQVSRILEHDSNTQFENPQNILIGIAGRIEDHLKTRCQLDFGRELMPVVQFRHVLVT